MNKRKTQLKGILAEEMFQLECIKRGIPVSKPVFDLRYDFVVEDDKGSLLKVQVKYVGKRRLNSTNDGKNVICLYAYSTNNGTSKRCGQKEPYTKKDIDIFAIWSEELEKFLWVPIEDLEGKSVKHFRITKPSKKSRVTYAQQYYW